MLGPTVALVGVTLGHLSWNRYLMNGSGTIGMISGTALAVTGILWFKASGKFHRKNSNPDMHIKGGETE